MAFPGHVEEALIPPVLRRVLERTGAGGTRALQRRTLIANAAHVEAAENVAGLAGLIYRHTLRREALAPGMWTKMLGEWDLDERTLRCLLATQKLDPWRRGGLAWMRLHGHLHGDACLLTRAYPHGGDILLGDAYAGWIARSPSQTQTRSESAAFDHDGWRRLAGSLDEIEPRAREIIAALAGTWEGSPHGLLAAAGRCLAA